MHNIIIVTGFINPNYTDPMVHKKVVQHFFSFKSSLQFCSSLHTFSHTFVYFILATTASRRDVASFLVRSFDLFRLKSRSSSTDAIALLTTYMYVMTHLLFDSCTQLLLSQCVSMSHPLCALIHPQKRLPQQPHDLAVSTELALQCMCHLVCVG